MVPHLHISVQMSCPVWLLLFSYSIRIAPSQSELVFLNQPADAVGVLNRPLMLHCAAYDSSHQKAIPVTWRKENGGLVSGVHQMANGALFFTQLKEEHQGRYICSAKERKSHIRSIATVSKAYLENVFFSPQSQSVDLSQDVFFQCVSGDSSPPAQISWLKNNRAFTRGTQIQDQYGGGNQRKTTGTLHLVSITKADQGRYVCVTHNSLLNISKESAVAILTVGGLSAGLEIIQGPENITVPVEMEAALHCVVHGYPTPKLRWFKDDQILHNTSRWDVQDDGQLLVFQKVLPEDEGFYYCEATNDKERLRSQLAYLLPAVMDWTFVLQPVNKTVRNGDSVTLSCRPPHSRPAALVSWFRNNRLLRSRPHFIMQPSGDLHFHSVQETDKGSYFCQASNTFLQRAVSSRKIFLDVLAPPSVTILPLAVLSTVGAEVVIQCQVSGHPIPSIEWSKQGQSARTGGKVIMGVRNATLYISSVRTHDEGVYTCAASNSVGQDQKSTTLRIAAKPVIILFSGSVNVSKGASINVPCQAVGNQPIKYTWRKSGLQTALSLLPHIYIDDNKTLHISNAHQSDSGEYYCTAENDMGRDSRKTIITVFTGDHEEDVLSTVPEIHFEEPTNPANYNLKSYKDVYLRDSPRHSISDATPNVANTPFNNHDVINFVDRQKNDVRKSSELLPVAFHSKLQTNAQQSHSYITAPTPVIQHSDHPTLHPSLQAEPWSVHTQFLRKTGRLSNQHASSLQDHLSPSSVVQGLGQLTQVTGFTNYNMNSMNSSTNTTDKEVNLSWSQPTEPLDATKASQTNNTEVVETLKKNTSKAPMRTTDNNAREKRKSQGWLPVIEEHDIPIVVGVGVSLAFIFITMTFYSLFRKNDPAAITTGRAAIKGPIGRPGEHLAIEGTYDNKAFEDDNMVAVIEQSPNTSETRAQRPASSPSTLLMEPSYEDAPEEVQQTRDFPVIVETHPDRDLTEEEQLETSFEDGKITPPHPSDIQLQCMEDWRSPDLGQCQDPPSPTPVNTVGPRESLRSSLTLQTSESSSTPVHHNISLSHNSCPLMLSHCVTMGMTSIAVDVHFYPSVVQNSSSTSAPTSSTTFGPSRPQGGSRPENDSAAPSAHNGK